MGEKIKDLKAIKVGKSKFMIELNEGYFNEGRVIHVQNSKFRYLFREQEFLKLCANILRSKSELDYLRSNRANSILPCENIDVVEDKYNDVLLNLKTILNEHKIRYKLIEASGRIITIIIYPNHYNNFVKAMQNNHNTMVKLNHPYGTMFGYIFLYQMKEFQLYVSGDVYIQVYCQLPCMSLEEKTWIPLDRCIQERIWDASRETKDTLDDESLFIYELCMAVFCYKRFSDRRKKALANIYDVIEKTSLEGLLPSVFFSFTQELIQMLRSKDYDGIINRYYSYNIY